MSLEVFSDINKQLKDITKQLAYHVVGDPLVLSNLEKYLDISLENSLEVNLTTAAYNMSKKSFSVLMHKAIRQINFSLNSYNANSHKISLQEYLEPILDFCEYAIENKQHFFINLRIWNLDESQSAKQFNKEVFETVNKRFNSNIDLDEVYNSQPKNIKIARMIFFNFDEYFSWPSLTNETISKTGFCYGLDSHFGILSGGKVVPCCLDKDGVIDLGDVKEKKLKDILSSKKVLDIQKGFKNNILVEELCQKCQYRTRFDK
jgi:radical SAM protein with 4Fe4S-binding SPASM domain